MGTAIVENEEGVLRLARTLATSGARSPVGVLIANLKAGEHRRPALQRVQGGNPYLRSDYARLPDPVSGPELQRQMEMAVSWRAIHRAMARSSLARSSLIRTMFHELRLACRDPESPTDVEGRRVRETLMTAIEEGP